MGTVNGLGASMGRYIELESSERRLLEGLERHPYRAVRGERLWTSGDPVQDLFILQDGWACTFRDTRDGERQIIELLLPGDILGLREFTLPRHVSEARLITSGIVCGFPHHEIVDLVMASPPLAIALFAAISRQEALLTERMMVTLHRSARIQVCHFVLETFLRLRKVRGVAPESMPFPISQQLLGQILGQSSVHINRILMALERDGVMKKHRDYVAIPDTQRLYDEAEFEDGYLSDRMDGLLERLEALRGDSR
ncbi:Crp/Fnr family transcriptional regulator [Halomonas organivorans]|uniref:CRP-like cAMP-binding protein n=1 Tax=Halomonas organivorans TaxID=257772 RepID=A0A7W5G6J9_9GAMM|nr:Crp/Fnr family transcriptional regulator [Halomonas organivorans]MBB3142235.1 CRP-like cAMP-binding protein [Halomonas organivorans]